MDGDQKLPATWQITQRYSLKVFQNIEVIKYTLNSQCALSAFLPGLLLIDLPGNVKKKTKLKKKLKIA